MFGYVSNGYRAALVATTASRFASDITFTCTSHSKAVNAKDVMSVMTLRAQSGTIIRITAIGPDEAQAIRVLVGVLSADDPG